MFERFTDEARRTVVVATETAKDVGDRRIGTEHFLAALAVANSPTAPVLARHGLTAEVVRSAIEKNQTAASDPDDGQLGPLGIDLDQVRAAAEDLFGPGALERAREANERPPRWRPWQQRPYVAKNRLPFTPWAKEGLEGSLRAALELRHSFIGAEHVGLGVLRCSGGGAYRLLESHRVDVERLRSDLAENIAA